MSWTKYSGNNKYDANLEKIQKVLKDQGLHNILAELNLKNVVVLNYKRFRSLYDKIYYLENLQSAKWSSKITLDRMLVESGKNMSEFRLESRMKSEVVLTFLKKV